MGLNFHSLAHFSTFYPAPPSPGVVSVFPRVILWLLKLPRSFLLLISIWLCCSGFSSARGDTLRLIGRGTLPFQYPFGKTKVGGLSGITYDATTRTFWAISDDSSYQGGPPRAYQLTLRLDQADLQPTIKSVLLLRDEAGKVFPVADCEGIAATGQGGLWVSNEGVGKAFPWVKLFAIASGKTLRSLQIPDVFLPADAAGKPVPIGDPSQVRGIIPNRAFESCALSPDRKIVYTANESSLVQEKAPGEGAGGASLFNATQIRVSSFDSRSGKCLAEKLYLADAGCLFGSVSDLAILDHGRLFVLERRLTALSQATGSYGIRIYQIDFNQPGVTDLRPAASVAQLPGVVPLEKTLLYDSRKSGLDDLDNIEGLVVVPLPGGRTGVVAISDDNFSRSQQTQLLLFQLEL